MIAEQIQVNTQSSIRVEGSKVIRFDPFQISAELHDADLILITHAHHDHFDPSSIRMVKKEGTVFTAPASMEKEVSKELPEADIHFVRPGDELDIEGIHIKAVPAYNKLKPFHPKKNQWVGYLADMDGVRYYFAGDTDAVPELDEIRCDIALVPVGGHYTMGLKEAAALINRIRPEIAIPVHFGSIVGKKTDGEAFALRVDEGIKVAQKLFEG